DGLGIGQVELRIDLDRIALFAGLDLQVVDDGQVGEVRSGDIHPAVAVAVYGETVCLSGVATPLAAKHRSNIAREHADHLTFLRLELAVRDEGATVLEGLLGDLRGRSCPAGDQCDEGGQRG